MDARVDTQAVLQAALAKLRPEEREVLTLVAWEDLTVADTALTATPASRPSAPPGASSRGPAVPSKLISLAALIKASGGSLPG